MFLPKDSVRKTIRMRGDFRAAYRVRPAVREWAVARVAVLRRLARYHSLLKTSSAMRRNNDEIGITSFRLVARTRRFSFG